MDSINDGGLATILFISSFQFIREGSTSRKVLGSSPGEMANVALK